MIRIIIIVILLIVNVSLLYSKYQSWYEWKMTLAMVKTLQEKLYMLQHDNNLLRNQINGKNASVYSKAQFSDYLTTEQRYQKDILNAVKYAMTKAHPDNPNGDAFLFQEYHKLYTELKDKYGR